MRKLKTNRAVDNFVYLAVTGAGDVYLAVNGTVNVTVYGAVTGNVYRSVWRAVSWAVNGAPRQAVDKDPPHPGLQDFLRETRVKRTARKA